jgi:hypothetical protein
VAMLKCPACGKLNPTEAACTRCGCDLARLRGVVAAAQGALAEGRVSLQTGDWAGALSWSEKSWRLLHSAEAARLAFLAAGAMGDTRVAAAWHRHGAEAQG